MALIVEPVRQHRGHAGLFGSVDGWASPASGSIVALDAADALAALLGRCLAVADGRPELWGASVAELTS